MSAGGASLWSYTQKALCAVPTTVVGNTWKGKADDDPALAAAIKTSLAESPMNLDMTVVCHEVRGMDLEAGKPVSVKVSDLRRGAQPGEVAHTELGKACLLRTLELDTTLLMRICVEENPDFGRGSPSPRLRPVSELRIPLTHLIKNYNCCLYYAWVCLEMPELDDSVNALGDLTTNDDGATLQQAITQGAKEFSKPRACISVCKSSDMGSNGKTNWSPDLPADARTALWGPLLRSWEQHRVLSTLLHVKCERQGLQPPPSQGYLSTSVVEELQDENAGLKAELEAAKSQLQAQQRRFADVETPGNSPGRDDLGGAESELELLRQENEQMKSEIHELNLELGVVGTEANVKIDQANDRIRTQRLRIEEAAETNQKLSDQNIQLTEQNKILRSVCEDLKRICEEHEVPTRLWQDHNDLVPENLDNTVTNMMRPPPSNMFAPDFT